MYCCKKKFPCVARIGLPFFGCTLSMGLNESNFWANLGSSFPISMVYFFGLRAVILSDPDLINHIFKNNSKLSAHVNDRLAQPKWREVQQDQVALIGKMYHEWPARRQLVVKALQRVLNHRHIDNIVSNTFSTILYKRILSDTNNLTNTWKSTNSDLGYFQFYLLFYSIFGNVTDNTSGISNGGGGNSGAINIPESTLKQYGAITGDYVQSVVDAGKRSQVMALMGLGFLKTKENDELGKLNKQFDGILINWINKHTKFGPNITDDIDVNDNNKFGKIVANMSKILSMEKNGPIFILDTLIDAMIDKKKYSQSGSKQLGQMNMRSVLAEISVLFIAGMDSTSNSMEYIIIQLAKRIKIQNEIYNELINYLNSNNIDIIEINKEESGRTCKTVDTSKIDFTKLTLLRAFIWECLRVSTVSGLGVPHVCNKKIDFQFKNKKYVIPKDTIIMFNSLFVNTSGKFWNNNNSNNSSASEKDIFDLGHWLNKQSGKFEMNNNFVGFGAGRRDCVGKHLAINILRRVMVLLLINFQIYGPNGVIDVDVDVDQSIQTKFKTSFTRSVDPAIPITLQPRIN